MRILVCNVAKNAQADLTFSESWSDYIHLDRHVLDEA